MTPACELHLSYPENRIKYCLNWLKFNILEEDKEYTSLVYKRLYHWIGEAENITYYD